MGTLAVGVSGSLAPGARSGIVLDAVLTHIRSHGYATERVDLLHLPSDGLLARRVDRVIEETIARVMQADIIVLGTPIYRATYAGQLKAFLDLFPQDAFKGRVVGLAATGAGSAHTLAVDHGLRPLIASMGGLSASTGIYVTDAQFPDKTTFPDELNTKTALLAAELHVLSVGYRNVFGTKEVSQ